ncbi:MULTISPECIES: VWA domain-containing protein [Lysinibacillus]|uniref:VWA domain-containing protein n=1 Tax=Lysinibacillus antri TaxID=2498145 RepID=A0A3S0RVN0_9BACI|nr:MULTISPECIES: VWA domain-containing protein [Lysinibacillus]RUL52167.1 VWA domain-containing protein [Lysinibacillus antri]TSI05256.1 VWA domain-containing protein [Lysinibacillus sp. BW-2-10]
MVRIYKQSEYILGKYTISIIDVSIEKMTQFNELLSYAKTLRSLCEEGEKFFNGFTNLVGDIWSSFYRPTFELNNSFNMNFHYQFIERMLLTNEYNNWKKLTQLDELLSLLTTEFFVQRIISYFQNSFPPNVKTSNPLNHSKIKQNVMKQLLTKEISRYLNYSKDAAIDLKKSIVQVSKMDGKNKQPAIKDQLLLAKELQTHSTLKQIAELTGKLKPIVQIKQNFVDHSISIKNIVPGHEIQNLIPSELAKYSLPASKLDFLKRLAERQALQYDYKNKNKGKGPIVFCVDESSSMSSIRNECKAFCMALLMIAKKQKRDMVIIPFANDTGEVHLFKKGQSTIEQIILFCNSFLGGGTNFEKPLKYALEVITTSEFNKADLLFLTDGSSFLSKHFIEEFNRCKKRKKCECISIILTNYFNAVDKSIVQSFSDQVIEVKHLFEATDVFSIGKSS